LGFAIIMWGVFPRWMGFTIVVAGPCLIANTALFLLWPGYDGELSLILSIPLMVSQFWLAGWMLVNTPHPAKNRDLYLSEMFREEQPQAQQA
jgi:hypothetical protein